MTVPAQFPDEQNDSGEFARQEDAFRERVEDHPQAKYGVASGRYHLYVSLACPWASRTVIVRQLLGLEDVIGMTVLDPIRDDLGWAFREGPGHGLDPINGFSFLSQAYQATTPGYQGRVTVPVLWDKETRQIVNNSEDDICRMLHDVFRGLGDSSVDLFPDHLEDEQAKLAAYLYEHINNGVYQAGFATAQKAYEEAARDLFQALDKMDDRLGKSRYLCGNQAVEVDWRFFCTLVRFDAVYHGHFKCNLRRIVDYPNLYGYLRDLYQQTGIAATVNMDHIKRHYYYTHDDINPTRIVPIGPELNFTKPHGREGF